MPSKMVMDHENAARSTDEAADTYAAPIAEVLAPRFDLLLKRGEQMPDIALCVRLLGRLAFADAQALSAADDANEAELADDVPLRQVRDRDAEQLYALLVDLRDAMLPAYGAAGLAAMHLSEPVPREPKSLARLGTVVSGALRGPAKLTPRRSALKIDRARYADEIEPLAAALTGSVATLEREGKEQQQTLDAKTKSFATAERSLAGGAGAVVALLELSGLEKLAERVLPILRRAPSREPDAPAPSDPPA